ESYLTAAKRRLQEELHLEVALKPLDKFYYQAGYASVGSEKEIDQLFIGFSDQIPKPDPQEIYSWQYLSLEKIKKTPLNYAPWFKLILKKLALSVIFNS
ncbi:MAG: NUDIX domain-containing protein, partial [Patescibacteria group bacterium]|nr:NUDIX domain-containing protein [Patescibacteria group bacterium]